MSKSSTRDSLMDAAEELIARKGYDETSLREITSHADANLAAVSYHFGSKEGLAAAMVERRVKPLNKKRLELLEEEIKKANQNGREPDVETLLRALIEPILRFFKSGEGGENFMKIFSQIHSDSSNTIRKHFLEHMVPVFKAFFEAFQKALPVLPPEKLAARMFFCIGAMAHGANILVDKNISSIASHFKIPTMSEPEALMEELIQFITCGMVMS